MISSPLPAPDALPLPNAVFAAPWRSQDEDQTTLTDLRKRPVPANGHDGCDDDRAVSSSRAVVNRSRHLSSS
jgi:hypothetical protein